MLTYLLYAIYYRFFSGASPKISEAQLLCTRKGLACVSLVPELWCHIQTAFDTAFELSKAVCDSTKNCCWKNLWATGEKWVNWQKSKFGMLKFLDTPKGSFETDTMPSKQHGNELQNIPMKCSVKISYSGNRHFLNGIHNNESITKGFAPCKKDGMAWSVSALEINVFEVCFSWLAITILLQFGMLCVRQSE